MYSNSTVGILVTLFVMADATAQENQAAPLGVTILVAAHFQKIVSSYMIIHLYFMVCFTILSVSQSI
jgi:hypothetical protein